MGRRLSSGSRAPAAALAAAIALAAGGGRAAAPAGSWLHPSFGAGHLEGNTVVVLPVGRIIVPEAAPSDSAAIALAELAGGALATAMEGVGAAGIALEPAEALAALAGLSRDDLRALAASLDAGVLDPAQGKLPSEASASWREVADRADERYFLAPRSLAIERLEPLRVLATLDGWLVDAASGVVLWHAEVSARNPHAPSGAAADLYEAALEDAVAAAAGRLASRLWTVARTGADDFEAAAP